MIDPETEAPTVADSRNDAASLMRGKIGLLLSMVVSAGFGVLGGFLIGRRGGEAHGLALGLELGRLQAAAALTQPRPGRRLWRRAATV